MLNKKITTILTRDIFQISFITFIILFWAELLYQGFVSSYINLSLMLFIVLISAIMYLYTE